MLYEGLFLHAKSLCGCGFHQCGVSMSVTDCSKNLDHVPIVSVKIISDSTELN